ncbi:hypothetical protein PQJ75_19980 [Rhodoplanes sp. TEM]|uniref:Major facilitator superfamily (MFS) profile domain-containing protein n=1 Tax=Rhodoplanes tepidamans TaxID=200616 RepID=A0ABT5JI04_RHOTP|nr:MULTISPECIES: hypothetical protein [Rhodoplanes]MDC7789325.1 hypothetical protein [Rhodoplanes tepidamans]MDC7986014.1 hypothetical protein [Rhodoplanes sp. TEM]MDQ0358996.1 MFS family permease [Rhodoplanes tepidamans]
MHCSSDVRSCGDPVPPAVGAGGSQRGGDQFQASALATAFIYPQVTDPTVLLFAGFASGITLSGMIGGYGALISESYPTQARATAQNILFNFGRGVGGFGPLVVGWLASKYSLPAALSLLVIAWAIDIVVTVTMIKERRGEPLT